MKLQWRLVTACLFILLLAGCATRSIRKDFAFDQNSKDGIVVFSVSHDLDGGHASKAIFYMDEDNKKQMFFSLNDAVPGIAGGSDFEDCYGNLVVIALPPGKHQFDGWQITNGSGLHIYPEKDPAPLVFTVNSGQIKYLGNLHAYTQRGRNFLGISIVGNGYVETLDRRERDIPLFESEYPQFAGKATIDLLPLGVWAQNIETKRQVDIPRIVAPVLR